jgi:hypothetical protein
MSVSEQGEPPVPAKQPSSLGHNPPPVPPYPAPNQGNGYSGSSQWNTLAASAGFGGANHPSYTQFTSSSSASWDGRTHPPPMFPGASSSNAPIFGHSQSALTPVPRPAFVPNVNSGAMQPMYQANIGMGQYPASTNQASWQPWTQVP